MRRHRGSWYPNRRPPGRCSSRGRRSPSSWPGVPRAPPLHLLPPPAPPRLLPRPEPSCVHPGQSEGGRETKGLPRSTNRHGLSAADLIPTRGETAMASSGSGRPLATNRSPVTRSIPLSSRSSRAGAQGLRIRDAAPFAHPPDPLQGLGRPQQDGASLPIPPGDHVDAIVHAVREVHVQVAGWAEHDRGAGGASPIGVAGGIVLPVCLALDDAGHQGDRIVNHPYQMPPQKVSGHHD
jgi:hypothetical protein